MKTGQTYSVTCSLMNETETTYYWRVTATDGTHTTNETYMLTTSTLKPIITNPLPSDDSKGVSINLSILKFNLNDLQNDSMNWTVETSPDIGSGLQNNVGNGQYTVSISGLAFNITYTWYVNVTDGTHWTNESFTFTTKPTPGIWWDTSWTYRKEIVLNNSNIVGSHVNFPMIINCMK